jgi:hypothetical protein
MRRVHVPDVLRTGCFFGCRLYKALETKNGDSVYVLQYQCKVLEDYYRYRDDFAPALQKEHSDRYAGRFRACRQLLEDVGEIEFTK